MLKYLVLRAPKAMLILSFCLPLALAFSVFKSKYDRSVSCTIVFDTA